MLALVLTCVIENPVSCGVGAEVVLYNSTTTNYQIIDLMGKSHVTHRS